MTKVVTITTEQLEEKKKQAETGGFIPETRTKVTKVKNAKGSFFNVSFDIDTSMLDEKTGDPIQLSASGIHIGKYMPHQDFTDAINMLKPHLAIVCDLKEVDGKELLELNDDEETLEKIHVTGFSLTETDIKLEGFKVLKSGNVLPLLPPPIPFFDDYMYADEIQHSATHAANEALKYMKYKYAPTLFDNLSEDGESEEEIY